MYRLELTRTIKVMCEDSSCRGECGLFHKSYRRAKSLDVRSSASTSSSLPPKPPTTNESDNDVHKIKRKKRSTKTKKKKPSSISSSFADRAAYDEWAQLDEQLHDQRHYFAPTSSVGDSSISLRSSEINHRSASVHHNHNHNHNHTVHIHEEIDEGAEKGKDNEWELLKEELVVKDEVDKARLFAADEAERRRQSMTSSPEAVTTLDDIIEAARRKSVVYKPGNNANKRKHHNLLEPAREDGGSSVQAILTDQHFATQLLDSDEEGGIVGDPPSTIDDDLDLEQLVHETQPPRDSYSNPTSKTADPLGKQLSRTRMKKKISNDDEMSVDFSVVDLSVTSRLSMESGYDDIEMLSSAVQAMAGRAPEGEYLGSLA